MNQTIEQFLQEHGVVARYLEENPSVRVVEEDTPLSEDLSNAELIVRGVGGLAWLEMILNDGELDTVAERFRHGRAAWLQPVK